MTHLHYSNYVWDGASLRPASASALEIPGYGVRETRHQPMVLSGEDSKFTFSMLALIGLGLVGIWYLGFRSDRPRKNPRRKSEAESRYDSAARWRRRSGRRGSRALREARKTILFAKSGQGTRMAKALMRKYEKKAPYRVTWQQPSGKKNVLRRQVRGFWDWEEAGAFAESLTKKRGARRIVFKEY